MTKRVDVVIASLPYVETDAPLMAPALLKGIVDKTNLSSAALDLNIEIIHYLNKFDSSLQEKITRWFLYEENKTCLDTQSAITELVNFSADRILEYKPLWICLSLFCGTAKKFNLQLCKLLKQDKKFTGKIVIGGNAVFTDEKSKRPYGKLLQKAKLIDHYIVGDGEEPLYNLLTNLSTHGVDQESFQILEDLSLQPFSNYDDYQWNLYTTKQIPMYGSRGCVRKCTFCDVHKLWKKFKKRDAEEVFKEMLFQIEKTNIRDFYFRDSLINGSISEFNKLMSLIADYNSNTNDKITWSSFFIFRNQLQMTEQDWAAAGRGGANTLIVGVESLVDSIRYHMKKKFTNADIDFSLAMAKKYNINIVMLLIVGYVTETEKDFQSALQWLEDHVQYAKTPLKNIGVGGTLILTDLSELYENAEDFNITIGPSIHLWENKSINLDYQTRESRKRIFIDKATSLGYTVNSHEKPVS